MIRNGRILRDHAALRHVQIHDIPGQTRQPVDDDDDYDDNDQSQSHKQLLLTSMFTQSSQDAPVGPFQYAKLCEAVQETVDREMTPESGSFENFGNLTILPPEGDSIEKEIDRIIEAGTREHPLHVLDLDDVVRKHLNWLRTMPRVTPFYAVKCNDDPAILATLARLGTGFDCASEAEIRTILGLGVKPERILFAHPIKSIPALAFARSHGIRRMTFDNECELEKVAKEYPDAELVLRIRHDADQALIPLGKKFGCNPRGDGLGLMDRAQELGVKVIGVSFHVGCGSLDADCFYHAIESVRVVFDYAQSKLGTRLALVDIGGGFPGDSDKPIQAYAEAVQRGLQESFPNPEEVTVIAEPGRYYVGSAVTLLSTIQGKKVIYDPEFGQRERLLRLCTTSMTGCLGRCLIG
ncbi:ornithine decarboxylase [Anopheles darlingi]|uniref:ornithine decarboxylase n=1 Tax=Anopheles darlingi TaxID=43151 RepID=W5J4G7_ANODA|nr:ornithine decarboxylase [Anopheles darlingi]